MDNTCLKAKILHATNYLCVQIRDFLMTFGETTFWAVQWAQGCPILTSLMCHEKSLVFNMAACSHFLLKRSILTIIVSQTCE